MQSKLGLDTYLYGGIRNSKMALHIKSLAHAFSNLTLRRPPRTYSFALAMLAHTTTSTKANVTVPTDWRGLEAWRNSGVNENRRWGLNGQEEAHAHSEQNCKAEKEKVGSLAEWGALVLSTADPAGKAWLTHEAYKQWCQQELALGVATPPSSPARPDKPQLVLPKEIPSPRNSPLPHNAYLLHNLAHIELNAIDLAWDTVVRFSTVNEVLGSQFFADFAHVADDESRHFSWCSQRLAELGFSYGDMPAHNILWRDCKKSSNSVSARLALIPMVQEARGLDAGPRLVQRLVGIGDKRSSDIVACIAEEEVAHVAVGVSWFMQVCRKTGLIPDETFRDLLEDLGIELKGPFNYSARTEAGIPRDWYDTSNVVRSRSSKQLHVTEDKEATVLPVYERLAYIIAMERDNCNQK